jgi:cyclopropane fatty-acyl-phospholipid synthase-like methyltransferase
MSQDRVLRKMRNDWDKRARANARHFIATGKASWNDDEFFRSGETTVAQHILNDLPDICQGKDPRNMRVLEIGCGAGRITRSLAKLFGEVHAVDVSGEMVARARTAVTDFPNVHIHQNNGTDLSVIPDLPFDFAFSYLVFQHVPKREIMYRYVRDVHHLLAPGALFKFQVLGAAPKFPSLVLWWKENFSLWPSTWIGVAFTEPQAVDLAQSSGFEARYLVGAEEQEFWLWFFKPGATPLEHHLE